jgi:hypothetical protein
MSLKLPIPAPRKKIPPKRQPEICCDLLELPESVAGGRDRGEIIRLRRCWRWPRRRWSPVPGPAP